MAYEFKLPDLGEGLTEGEIARWLVAEGDEIAEDDPLVEIQTDKTTVEIPSPAAGTVARILVAEGEVVPVGTVLVVIGADGGEPAARPPRPAEPAPERAAPEELVLQQHKVPSGRVQATPLVRRVAQELGVDLASLSGTGPNGRIVEDDVRRAAGAAGEELVLQQHKVSEGVSEGRREPLRGVRRQIVEHLARAHREVAAVTFVEECDFTDVDVKRLVPLTLLGGRRLAEGVPGAERAARGGRDRLPRPLRPRGRRADRPGARRARSSAAATRASIDELAAEVERLAEAARAGTLKPRGATRRHVHGDERRQARRALRDAAREPPRGRRSSASTGSARAPSSATGRSSSADIGNVSVTFDHRVVDGARAAAFTLDVIARLESGLSS